MSPASLRLERGRALRLIAEGDWVVSEAARLDRELRGLKTQGASSAEIDATGVAHLDTAGTWLLIRTQRDLERAGLSVAPIALAPRFQPLIDAIGRKFDCGDMAKPPPRPLWLRILDRTGTNTVRLLEQAYHMLGFVGQITIETVEAVVLPRRELPLPALVQQIEETGLTALPILGLLSFLLGIVIAYQGADQLRAYGAEIYTINLLGVILLREIGGLIAAIIVAGRSGSAFTAQIGTMRVNEEIDAMETLGLNVAELLVMPRVLALMITLPLLTFYADLMGTIGGALMTYTDLGITFPEFVRQFQSAVTVKTLMVGLIKAPVFAFLIGLVGCFEGLRVERNAASVGKLTTRSVVESIFLVIVFDAGFSVLFSMIGF